MITRTAQRAATAAALTMTAALALSACGESDGDQDSGTETDDGSTSKSALYDFEDAKAQGSKSDRAPFVATDPNITIQLSDELTSAVPSDRGVAIQKFELTSKAFTTDMCRLDADITYSKGGEQAIKTIDTDEKPTANVVEALVRHGFDADDAVEVDSIPSDDTVEEDAIYVTNDLSHLTMIGECNEDPDDGLTTLQFPYLDEPDADTPFADAEIAIMAGSSGDDITTTVLGTSAAKASPNGSWQPPED